MFLIIIKKTNINNISNIKYNNDEMFKKNKNKQGIIKQTYTNLTTFLAGLFVYSFINLFVKKSKVKVKTINIHNRL